eukprot:scaffold449_cov184-Amphora_coffeaeformis.AAC.10
MKHSACTRTDPQARINQPCRSSGFQSGATAAKRISQHNHHHHHGNNNDDDAATMRMTSSNVQENFMPIATDLRDLVGEFGMTLLNPLACMTCETRSNNSSTHSSIGSNHLVWDMEQLPEFQDCNNVNIEGGRPSLREEHYPLPESRCEESSRKQDMARPSPKTVLCPPNQEARSFSCDNLTALTTTTTLLEEQLQHQQLDQEAGMGFVVHVEDEDPIDLMECPRILTPAMMQQLQDEGLPTSLHMSRWERCFAIGRDGDDFWSFLERTAHFGKTIVVIQTCHGDILGGFAAMPWKKVNGPQNVYFGTGQSFLFASHPESQDNHDDDDDDDCYGNQSKPLHLFRWTGTNDFCQIADAGRLGMGGGADFGFLVQDNFLRGRTGPCKTFGNPALVPGGYFEIAALEVYGLRTFGETMMVLE